MNEPLELIQNYNASFADKNIDKVRTLLHDNFTFTGPMMQFGSPDEFANAMREFGFDCSNENVQFVSEDSIVVQVFDWVVTAPFKASIPMCEIFKIEEGKIFSSKLFFDTAKFPKMEEES